MVEELRKKRLELGLSQAKFAKLIGVPLSTYENWEMGIRKCPDYVVKLILFYVDNKEPD